MPTFDIKYENMDQATMLAVFNGEQPTDQVPAAAITPIAGLVNGFPVGSMMTLAVRGNSKLDGTLQQLIIEVECS